MTSRFRLMAPLTPAGDSKDRNALQSIIIAAAARLTLELAGTRPC